jgi:hypothetical protein
MFEASIRLRFTGGNEPEQTFEAKKELPEPRDNEGEKRLSQCFFHELEKQSVLRKYYEALPDIEDFFEFAGQAHGLEEFCPPTYFNRRNTQWTWREISNAVTFAKFKLAESRSYKDIEQTGAFADRPDLRYVHILKMDCFHLAMLQLTRIQDLVLRLIFENLGASVIQVDLRRPNWERSIIWDKMMDGLKKGRVTNPVVEGLSDGEYTGLLEVLRDFRNPRFVAEFISYRDRTTHGFLPSVDYPDLYFATEDRLGNDIRDSGGKLVGTTWAIKLTPERSEVQFLELYKSATDTLAHWLGLLRKLRLIPRFGPTDTL